MDYNTAYRIASSYDYNHNYIVDRNELYIEPNARARLTQGGYGPVFVAELAAGMARNDVYIGADRTVRLMPYPRYYPAPVYPAPVYYYPSPVVTSTLGGEIVGGVIGGLAGGRRGAYKGAVIGGAAGLISGLLH